MFRIFLAQQRSAPEVSVVTAILQRWLAEPAPGGRASRPPARELLDRLVVGHPAALPGRRRPRPQRAVPLVRPAAGRRRPGRGAGGRWATSSTRSTPCPTAPTAPTGSTRWWPSPSASCGSSASGSRRPCPTREPMLEVLIQRHYREYALHDLREVTVDGRAVATADYRLDGRDSHLVSDHGDDRRAGRRHRARLRCWPGWSVRPRTATRPSSTSTCTGATCRTTGRGRRRRSPTGWRGCRSRPGVRRVAVARRARRRPRGRLLHLPPAGRRPMDEDRLVRGVHPMVGRRLNLWRLRDFDAHPARGARGRAAATLRRRRTTRRTSGWWRWPRCASSPWCATRPAGSRRCRTPSGPLANCLEAIRRARAARGAAGPARHEPRLAAHLARRSRPTSTS